MKPIQLSDSISTLLTKSMDLRSINQQVIASNIANAETPNYAPARFQFAEELKQALQKPGFTMQTTDEKHISTGPGTIGDVHGILTREPTANPLGDGNGVSVDDEMIALSENQLLYETAAQLLKKRMTMLKYAISGGQ